MRIVCPNCAAAYEVPANRLKQRQTVRCARCAKEWTAVRDTEPPASTERTPVADAPPPAEPKFELPAITAMDRLVAGSRRPRASIALVAAWVLTLGVLGGGAAAVIVWRDSIVDSWPPSARILGTKAGLGVNMPAGGREIHQK